MEIQYLKKLKDNPIVKIGSVNNIIKPIPLAEIAQLEQLYNNGNPFPKALRELLYLAGEDCYVLDYGLEDSQQELQEFVRERMDEENQVITRPFYAIDVYNGNDQFLFVYLDEGDNPPVYEGNYYKKGEFPWIHKLVPNTLSEYISDLIDQVKEGFNPF